MGWLSRTASACVYAVSRRDSFPVHVPSGLTIPGEGNIQVISPSCSSLLIGQQKPVITTAGTQPVRGNSALRMDP
jgi:hypothetical protein